MMIDVGEFIGFLDDIDINFFCGVPDSQLSPFCDYLEENCQEDCFLQRGLYKGCIGFLVLFGV